jgi:hypothetical protein
MNMGIVKNFLDELSNHKFLVYFVTLWGAMLFLWTVYGFIEYGFHTDVLGIIDLFFHLSELIAGAILIIIGVKLLNTDFLKEIKSEKLFVYFLILWAATFFFWGLYVVVDYGASLGYAEHVIAFLGGLAALFAGIVLGLFSWKLLNEAE